MKYPDKEIINYIHQLEEGEAKNIVLVPHINPDGDAIGSTLALYHYFKEKHHVELLAPSSFPHFLEFLEGSETIIDAEENKALAEEKIAQAHLIIICDHNAPDRSGVLEQSIANSQAVKLMIDHHPNPTYPVDYAISETQVSSTCELVYNFISTVGEIGGNQALASAIYLGVMTDTGNFMHNVHGNTFSVVSHLLETGIDRDYIYNKVFNNYSEQRMRLVGYALLEKMQLCVKGKVAVLLLTEEELRRFSYVKGDTEGLVNLPLAIGGVVASVLVIEHAKEIKFSFRSKGDVAVNGIAKQYYNGGGHKNAAGGRLEKREIEEVRLELIDRIEKHGF